RVVVEPVRDRRREAEPRVAQRDVPAPRHIVLSRVVDHCGGEDLDAGAHGAPSFPATACSVALASFSMQAGQVARELSIVAENGAYTEWPSGVSLPWRLSIAGLSWESPQYVPREVPTFHARP